MTANHRWRLSTGRQLLTGAARFITLGALGTLMVNAPDCVRAGADPGPPALSADALILSLPDVSGIVGAADLTSRPLFDVHEPRGDHQYDGQYPSQCHAIFDQDAAFGATLSQFRSVQYSGAANRAVTQAVGVYPSRDAARAALVNLAINLQACSDLHVPDMAITVQKLDNSSIAVCQTQCATLYRQAGPVLIGVDAVHFGDSDRIATAVLKQISARVS